MKLAIALLLSITFSPVAAESRDTLREEATRALERAIKFFHEEVAVKGTYLWQYSDDLSKREGEGKATRTQAWVQPPGTPTVGMAFLSAWEATSNRYTLEGARETARGLARGQMRSGGWHYSIEFDPTLRSKFAYRDGGGNRARNVTTFDDDTTQAALRYLVRLDSVLGFADTNVQEVITYAFNAILKAQYPNGAWPQGYEEFPDPAKYPVKRASYPESWPRTWPGSGQYWLRYTLNDNSLATIIDTLFETERTYRDARADSARKELGARAAAAARKAGDFILLAQMPEPQPAWAQQYDFDMHPSWARKFEPPAISGGESQGALRALLKLYRHTGDRKYLEPVPRALEYLRTSRVSDGRLARFYELRSNKPLYFTKEYELTYNDADMPTHYAFKVSASMEAIARDYEEVKNLSSEKLQPSVPTRTSVTDTLRSEVRAIIASQDARGRWVEDGPLRYHGPNDNTTRIIRSATVARNVETLSRYLVATR